jgi:2-methylcitrate dehydratase PrpD
MSLSRQLASFALSPTYESLPASTMLAAKRLLLDAFGVAIAAYDAPGVNELRRLLCDWGGRPDATGWVGGELLPLPNAAMLNSVMVHALDLDDVHLPATLHILSSVAPVAIACGQQVRANGRDVLAAMVMAVEVAGRLGVEYEDLREHEGFLPSTIIGGFGATTAACRLFGLDVEQTVNAFGIFYAQVSGNRQALHDKTLTKRMQPGLAARDAVWAAELASRGVSGAEHCFEGSAGLFRIYGTTRPPEPDRVFAPHDWYEIERVSVKQFPSCGATHRAVLATLELVNQHELDARDIAQIDVGLGASAYHYVGQPFQMGPGAEVQAQFCADYCVALAAVHRRVSLDQFTPEYIHQDAATLEMLHRVYVRPEIHQLDHQPVPTDKYREPQTVVIHLCDGRKLASGKTYQDVLAPENTSDEAVIRKLTSVTSRVEQLTPSRAERLIKETLNLERSASVHEFVQNNLVVSGIEFSD